MVVATSVSSNVAYITTRTLLDTFPKTLRCVLLSKEPCDFLVGTEAAEAKILSTWFILVSAFSDSCSILKLTSCGLTFGEDRSGCKLLALALNYSICELM